MCGWLNRSGGRLSEAAPGGTVRELKSGNKFGAVDSPVIIKKKTAQDGTFAQHFVPAIGSICFLEQGQTQIPSTKPLQTAVVKDLNP